MRANEACSNAAKALHTCMAGSKGNVKASKSSVSLPRIFDPRVFVSVIWLELIYRSITYSVRLVKAVKPTWNLTIYQKAPGGICACGRGEGGSHIDIGFGILLYKHHALLPLYDNGHFQP
jgi:hypothetical protein